MAATLQLIRRHDGTGTISTFDLLDTATSGTTYTRLSYGGWTPTVAAGMSPAPLPESMTLRIRGTSWDNLATEIQSLDAKVKEASWYTQNQSEMYGVWLRAQMTGETEARDAYVYELGGALGDSPYTRVAQDSIIFRNYHLSMLRAPWWEQSSTTNYTAANFSCGGGGYDYGTVTGDVPARVRQLTILGHSLTANLNELWLGFRTDRYGTRGNFQPVWDCAASGADMGTATSRDSGSTYTITTFSDGDNTMDTRVTVEVADVTSDYTDQRGRFAVLLVARTTGSSTARVRLQDGYSGASSWRTQSRVKVDSSVWYVYAIGTVRIPPVRGQAGAGWFRRYALRIQAERTSGSGNLEMDQMYLVPLDEGAIHIDGADVDTTDLAHIQTSPDEKTEGWQLSSALMNDSLTVEPQNWGMPVGAGRVILVAQGSSRHYKIDTATVTFSVLPRWRTLRGSE